MFAPESCPLWLESPHFPVNLRLLEIVLAISDTQRRGWLNPGNSIRDLMRHGAERNHRPFGERTVDDPYHAGVLDRIKVEHRLLQVQQLEAQSGDVILITSQEEPAWLGAILPGIALQRVWIVFPRL